MKYVYEGYHYLIDMMEQCDKYYKYTKWYDIFIFFYILLILSLGIFIFKKEKMIKNYPINIR